LRKNSKFTEAVVAALVAVATAAIYLIFRSAYYFPDAMRWELGIAGRGAQAVWHPHHLIYNPLAVAFHAVLKLFGYGGRLFGAMQILDALIGGAGVALAYAVLRRTSASRRWAVAGALSVAFSFGYWAYACNAESVALSTVAAMATLWAALWAGEGKSTGRWALCGVAAGVAVLTHITNGLLLAFVLAAYFLSPPRKKWVGLPAVLASFALPVAALYAAAAFIFLGYSSAGDAWRWVAGVPGHSQYYMSYRVYNVVLDLYALTRNFFGLRWAKDVVTDGWTAGYAALAAVLVVAGVAVAAALIFALIRFGKKGSDRRPLWLGLALLLPFAAFFTFRDAGGIDRWTTQVFALLFLAYAGLRAGGASRAGRIVLVALPALLFVGNFAGSIYPESKEQNNEHLAFVRFVDGVTEPGDMVIFDGTGGLGTGIYPTYFAGVETTGIYFGVRDPATFHAAVDETLAAGRAVYVSDARSAAGSADVIGAGGPGEYDVTGEAAAELLASYRLEYATTYHGPRYAPSRFWRLLPRDGLPDANTPE
jgi:hypothetical protein